VIGLGPIGQMCARIATYLGAEQVIAVDSVPERLELARRHGIAVLDERTVDDVPAAILEMTGGRGVDGVVDAVGMEAHGTPFQAFALAAAGKLPGPLDARPPRRWAWTGWARCGPRSRRSGEPGRSR